MRWRRSTARTCRRIGAATARCCARSSTTRTGARSRPSGARALFDLTLADIATRISEARAVAGFGHVQTHVSLTRLMLDEQGWQEISDLLAGVLEEAMEIEAECAGRRRRGGAREPLHGSNLAMLHFGRAERRTMTWRKRVDR